MEGRNSRKLLVGVEESNPRHLGFSPNDRALLRYLPPIAATMISLISHWEFSESTRNSKPVR